VMCGFVPWSGLNIARRDISVHKRRIQVDCGANLDN
jgi:hypothetical protein